DASSPRRQAVISICGLRMRSSARPSHTTPPKASDRKAASRITSVMSTSASGARVKDEAVDLAVGVEMDVPGGDAVAELDIVDIPALAADAVEGDRLERAQLGQHLGRERVDLPRGGVRQIVIVGGALTDRLDIAAQRGLAARQRRLAPDAIDQRVGPLAGFEGIDPACR